MNAAPVVHITTHIEARIVDRIRRGFYDLSSACPNSPPAVQSLRRARRRAVARVRGRRGPGRGPWDRGRRRCCLDARAAVPAAVADGFWLLRRKIS